MSHGIERRSSLGKKGVQICFESEVSGLLARGGISRVGVLEAPFDFPPFAQHTKRNRNEMVYFHVLPVLAALRGLEQTLARSLARLRFCRVTRSATRNARTQLIHNHSLIRLRAHITGTWKVQASSMWFVLLLEMRDVCCRCRQAAVFMVYCCDWIAKPFSTLQIHCGLSTS